MTANKLKEYFNRTFGTDKWPKTFEVDSKTYGNCCQAVFNHLIEIEPQIRFPGCDTRISVYVGENNGLMFKNVELIINDKLYS